MARRTAVSRLDDHPNLPEVLEVLARLAHVGDEDLPRLAAGWRNDVLLAGARDRALSPDSPLVCEVLAAFETVAELFADDLRGDAPYVSVDPSVAVRALKAVRDAIAAAYARPVLTRAEHAALMRPWRAVYAPGDAEPDLGPQSAEVQTLLRALPPLAARCHDSGGQERWDALVDHSYVAESEREQARTSAFTVAVLTRRRRLWALVRRSAVEALGRSCPTCRPARRAPDREAERVRALCLDAACGLLVADALPDATTALLTAPVRVLVPAQRRSG